MLSDTRPVPGSTMAFIDRQVSAAYLRIVLLGFDACADTVSAGSTTLDTTAAIAPAAPTACEWCVSQGFLRLAVRLLSGTWIYLMPVSAMPRTK